MLTAEQLEKRREFIGASEIAMLTGHSPYGGPWELYNLKTGAAPSTRKPSLQTELGDLLEDDVLELYARKSGRKVTPNRTTVVMDGLPLGATPDAYATGNGPDRIVQAKTCVPWLREGEWGEPNTGQIPSKYLPQVQLELLVTGYSICDVPVLFGTQDFAIYTVEYDSDFAAAMVSIAVDFWNRHVVARVPPKVDESEACTTFLAAQFQRSRGDLRTADERAETIAQRYRRWAMALERAEKEVDTARNELRALIADADGVEGPDWRATWRPNKNGKRSLRVTFNGEAENE